MDPLKVPAFMRNKTAPKRKTANCYKPTKLIKTVTSEPPKIRIPKRLRTTSSLPADPSPGKLNFPADPIPFQSVSRGTDLVLVGVVTQYFAKINVASIKLGMNIEVGDKLQLEGEYGSFKQTIQSMQIDRNNVEQAGRGQEIGMKINKKVKVGELVYVVR